MEEELKKQQDKAFDWFKRRGRDCGFTDDQLDLIDDYVIELFKIFKEKYLSNK